MKLPIFTLFLFSAIATSEAFTPPTTATTTTKTTSLAASSRRDVMEQIMVGSTTTAAAAAVVLMATLPTPSASAAEARPMYLSEPTEEFKANEEKAMAFKRQQLAQKKKFEQILDQLMNEKNDEDALEADLMQLRKLVIETEGLPVGIKKDDFFKQVRTKKARGYWPTKVEIAYQGLKNEIKFQQSPDSENKAEGSPY